MCKVKFSKMKNGEFFDLTNRVITTVDNFDAAVLGIEDLVGALRTAKETMELAMPKSNAYLVTPELDLLFGKRQKARVAFRRYVLSNNVFEDEATQADVRLVMHTVGNPGYSVSNQNQALTNSRFELLLGELTGNAGIVAAIDRLGATKWLERIQSAHTEYELKREERVREGSVKPKVKSETGKAAIRDAFEHLVMFVTVKAKISDNADYKLLLTDIEEIAKHLNAGVNARLAAKANSAEAPVEEVSVAEEVVPDNTV